ncbi:MAG: response regulator transcription factor [Coriobacteriaceae bacterium]|nr:response regulator transcription factor [Coriobacteriaceae bacterium]
MGARILIVEDDADINEIIAVRLARQGHTCTQAYSGTEGIMRLGGELAHAGGATETADEKRADLPYDLVICDLMLPGATGEELIGALRARDAGLPVIVISARTSTTDRIDLLKLGADDYLTKPFDLDELAARVEVQLRHRAPRASGLGDAREHASRGASPSGSLNFRSWRLDANARTFTACGEPVALTRIEFNLLEKLMEQPKRAWSKQDLFEAAWGEPYAGDDSTVTVHMSNIRAKLKSSGTDAYIKTVWGIGFKLSEE